MAVIGPVAGKVTYEIDGKVYKVAGDVKVTVNKATRETLNGLSGPAGFSETPRAPRIEAEIFHTGDTDLQAIIAGTNAKVQVDLNNGWTYVLNPAWQVGDVETTASEGKVTIAHEGIMAEPYKRG